MAFKRRVSKRVRKQRVALRARRRDDLARQMQQSALRLSVVAVCAVAVFCFAMNSDSVLHRFIRRHTPTVTLQTPPALTGIPFYTELPDQRIWLWIPGVSGRIGRQWSIRYPALEKVRVEKNWSANRITFLLRPRTPLVDWNRRGVDASGVVFPLSVTPGMPLPRLESASASLSPGIGPWLEQLSQSTLFWSQVSHIKEDKRGHWLIGLQNGLSVVWGEALPEKTDLRLKAFLRVQADAESNGGWRQIDLRFFDEGRIIVAGRKKP